MEHSMHWLTKIAQVKQAAKNKDHQALIKAKYRTAHGPCVCNILSGECPGGFSQFPICPEDLIEIYVYFL